MLAPGPRRLHGDVSRQQLVLILSNDAVAAALLGGLVETLGYVVRFPLPTEAAEESLRRVRPRICLVDCDDPGSCHAEFFGRATMRGVCVVIFGTARALDQVRAIALEHDIETLTMPPEMEALELVLQEAGANDR
jgi:CheY-like chemotaxis protein